MILIDSNVVIDIVNQDQHWTSWSQNIVDRLSDDDHTLAIDQIVLAEIASNFPTLGEAMALLDSLDIELVPLADATAFAAGHAFRAYRRDHRDRDAILADFLIGAHARQLGAALLTRDVTLYRRYFPDLPLITPETHP